jgi:hypothetical protein
VDEVADPAAGAKLKSSPVPVSETVCGLSAALSVRVIAPVRLPVAVGLNVTLIVQLAFTARLAPQLFVWAKSPLAEMFEMLSGSAPELVRVTVCALLVVPVSCPVKVNEVVEKLAAGVIPVPVRLTIWVAPGTLLLLSVTVRVPVNEPRRSGEKVTLMTQLALAASGVLVLQVVPFTARANSYATMMLVKVRGTFPVLVTVTDFAALVVATV